jgi:hypothetical protein
VLDGIICIYVSALFCLSDLHSTVFILYSSRVVLRPKILPALVVFCFVYFSESAASASYKNIYRSVLRKYLSQIYVEVSKTYPVWLLTVYFKH